MDYEECSDQQGEKMDKTLLAFLKKITEGDVERAEDLLESCHREKIFDVALLKKCQMKISN